MSQKFKPKLLELLPVTSNNLKTPAIETGFLTKVLKRQIECMKLTCCMYNLISLSHIQVDGTFNMFLQLNNLDSINQKWYNNKAMPYNFKLYLNPKITQISNVEQYGWEKCVQYGVLEAYVRRFEKIRFQYMNEEGHTIQSELQDFPARVFQQNIQFLQGKTFLDLYQTQGNIKITDKYASIPETQFLKSLLEDYKKIGEQELEKNPHLFEFSLESMELDQEKNNPRVQFDIPDQLKDEKSQQEIEEETRKIIIEDLVSEINDEVQYIQEYLKLPEKRKIKKEIQINPIKKKYNK